MSDASRALKPRLRRSLGRLVAVFFALFKGQPHFGIAQGVLGLVIEEEHSVLPQFADKELNYGVVVPAQFIRETLDMLPAPPDEEATGSTK
jgi:hypothetical protein